jgi:hypothetical protein
MDTDKICTEANEGNKGGSRLCVMATCFSHGSTLNYSYTSVKLKDAKVDAFRFGKDALIAGGNTAFLPTPLQELGGALEVRVGFQRALRRLSD